MKKILSIILITACLACGCSSASGTGKTPQKVQPTNRKALIFLLWILPSNSAHMGIKKYSKVQRKYWRILKRKYPSQIPEVRYIISIRTFIHTASSIPRDSSVLLSSFFTRSMVFAHIPKAQLLFALLSETFLTIRQNSLNVTVCMIARSSCRGYFIHSLSTLYYYNAPSLATRLTGDYRDRTFTGKCGPASLDTQYNERTAHLPVEPSFRYFFQLYFHF